MARGSPEGAAAPVRRAQQASGESGTEAPPSRAHAGPPRGMVEAPESRLVPGQTGTVGPTDFHGAANYACCMTLEAASRSTK